MQASMVSPLVSVSNGAVVAGHTYADQVSKLASAVNRFAGKDVVTVGEPLEWDGKGVFAVDGAPVAVNPVYGRQKDPHGWALAGIVALATAPKSRKRATGTAAPQTAPKTAPKTADVAGTRTRRAAVTPKPAKTAARTTAATKTAATKTAVKVGASA